MDDHIFIGSFEAGCDYLNGNMLYLNEAQIIEGQPI